MTGTPILGPAGIATRLDVLPDMPNADTTVCWWLLEGPWHPAWHQFILSVVRLADVPGKPPAVLHFPGATHEVLVLALNPPEGGVFGAPARHPVDVVQTKGLSLGYLRPVDVVHQFTGTDDELAQVTDLAAQACIAGLLTPSTDDDRERLREVWLGTYVRTLAHIRGEAHQGCTEELGGDQS